MTLNDKIMVTLVGVLTIVLLYLGATVGRVGPSLSEEDQFMKAQFCVQTGRTPFVHRTNVVCHRPGGHSDEEAP